MKCQFILYFLEGAPFGHCYCFFLEEIELAVKLVLYFNILVFLNLFFKKWSRNKHINRLHMNASLSDKSVSRSKPLIFSLSMYVCIYVYLPSKEFSFKINCILLHLYLSKEEVG